MSKLDDAYERFLVAIATRSSERVILALAASSYAGIGLALPLVLAWSVPWLVFANVIGTMFAGTLLLMWLAAGIRAVHRRHLIEWTTDLRLLDAQEFEWLVGEIFRRDGWNVEESGRQDGPDGAIDLMLTRAGERMVVQCKRWTSWRVGVDAVRAFAGALMREGLTGRDGVYVTLSDFTGQARAEAKTLGLRLIDNRDLYERVEHVRRPELCSVCQAPMALDRSKYGWWLRCLTPGCSGKRDLGRDPARAVELLMQPPT